MDQFSQHSNQSDEELLQYYRNSSDSHWLGVLLQRYTLLLLGVAMKYLKDKTAAQDAVQQVFLKALTHLPKEEIKNFKGWLYVLVRNHCLQQLRDRHHHADETALAAVGATETDREALQLKEHTLEQLNEALLQLNEEQRKTIVLFYLHKQSYEQVCMQTGYSFAQVKSYIQNGRRNLKQMLSKKQGNGS